MKRKYLGIFLLIFLLGSFLRFYKLGEIPPGFHRDEAFLGYNAYSILKTGKDINGNFLPLHLQSFLYSPAGYSYLAIPSITLFGLNAFSVRFPSALFGALAILTTYFLVKEMFKNNWLAFFSAFFLAISPWHINLSRTATENVPVVFFLTLGVLFWLYWLKKSKRLWLYGSFCFFGLTLILYQAPRAFLPLFVPVLIFFSCFKNKSLRKKWVAAWLLFLLTIILPLLLILCSKSLSLRIRTVSLFATQQTQLVIDQQIREDGVTSIPIFLTRLFHNKPFGYLSQFLENYFAHFSYDFLFTDKGLPNRYRVPLVGLLYFFELPLIFLGIWRLLKLKNKNSLIIFAWLLLAPLGSALTFDDVPNLQRALISFPTLSIILAFGLLQMTVWLKRGRLKFLLLPLVLFGFFNFFFYFHQYYVHFPWYQPWHRNDGYKSLVEEVNELLPEYKKVIITNYESAPTIFFLFFNQYDPGVFQKEIQNAAAKDFDRIAFGRYEFSEEQCPLRLITSKDGRTFVNGEEKVLYVNSGLCKMPIKDVNELAQIKRKDNSLVFRVLEYQK